MIPRKTYTVDVIRYSAGADEDAHGNSVAGYGDPEPLTVFGIAPATSAEPVAGRNLVVTGYTLFAPTGTVIGPLDKVLIDGEEWQVNGLPGDWNRGPFGYTPGISIALKRAEG